MKKIVFTLSKVVVAMLVITVLMLLLLALLMLKMDLGEGAAKAFVVVIYIISTFTGGMIAGKVMNEKKYLWGAAVGLLYFAVVLVLAFVVKNETDVEAVNLVTTVAASCLGGMFGGMVA